MLFADVTVYIYNLLMHIVPGLSKFYRYPYHSNLPFCFFHLIQGYFQLKAYPGAWSLSVREGRSSEIYDIERYHFYFLLL